MPSDLTKPSADTSLHRHRGASSWLAKFGLAVAAPVLFFALMEAGLRLAGVGRNTDFFIPDDQPGIYRTNLHYTELFFPASFGLKPLNFRLSKVKPAGSIRVFVLGESAAMGVPEPGFAIAPQLRAQLRAAYPDQQIDVYNLGITAINSHVVRHIVRQAVQFQPDLLVIYMGNNEVIGPYGPGSAVTDAMLPPAVIRASIWLRCTRTGQLLERGLRGLGRAGRDFKEWRGMEMFADKAVRANDPRMEAVYRNFAANLTAILELACGAGIKTVVSTVAVNIKDSAPFASRHRSTLSPANLQAWQEAVDRADEAMGLGDTARAQALWKQAVAIDPEYADTHFQLAQVLAEQAELESPRRHYLEALQWDALRFRCDARLNQIIRRCASSAPGAVVLVDAAQAMESDGSSTAAPAGRAWFFEHVHLTWEGNYDLARLLAAGAAPLLFGTDRPPARWLSPTECAQAVGYTEFGRATMLRRMAELTARPPFAGQLGFAADRARLEREIAAADAALMASGAMPAAAEAIESASRRDPLNPFLVFQEATVNLQIGNLARALELNRRLSALEPPSPETAAQQAFLLQQLRRTDEAEAVLLRSAATDPFYFQTYGLLGSLWAATGQLPKAREYFAALTARMPESIGARLTYAQVLEASGDGSAAEQQWRAVLRLTPDNDVALDALVQRLYARHQDGAALDLMLQAYVSNPRNFANNARLEAIFEARGDLKATVTYLQAMADSGPVKAVLHLDLALDLAKLGRRAEMLVELRRARSAAEADGDSELRQRADDLIRQQGSSSP